MSTDKGVSGGAESESKADASVGWAPASVSGLWPVALSLSLFLGRSATDGGGAIHDRRSGGSEQGTCAQGCPGEPAITIGYGAASRFNRGRWASDGLGRTRWSAFGVCEVESGGAVDQAGGGDGDGTLVRMAASYQVRAPSIGSDIPAHSQSRLIFILPPQPQRVAAHSSDIDPVP